jgi:hypothetical protein
MATTPSRFTVAPSAGEVIRGPSGMSCESLAVPKSRSPAIVSPRKVYLPSGKRALNSASGTSVKGGSLLSEKSSVRPQSLRRPSASTSTTTCPVGSEIVIEFHGSPSRKNCSPASPSVSLTSMIRVAAARRTGCDAASLV